MIDRILKLIARQHWIRFGIRSRLIRMFYDPETVSSKEFETDFFGVKYRGNLNSYIDWNVFYYGAYEREYLFFIRNLIKDQTDSVFIDIGANVGQHSLFMSLTCADVHSFEPNPMVRRRLEEKVSINKIKNITVHKVGMGVSDDRNPYFAPEGHNQGTGSFIEGFSDNNNKEPIMLEVVNGDKYISELTLNKIDLIKIDVEGYEKYVLTGLKETLIKYRPLVVMEYSGETKESFQDFEEFIQLFPSGYSVKRILCNKPVAKLFNSPCCRLEDFDFHIPGHDLFLYPNKH